PSTEPLVAIAGWKYKRETRRKRWHIFAFHRCLQTVVEPHVFDPVVIFRKEVRNRVGELVCLTEDRPFLSKTRGDLTRAVSEINWQIEYVLHHSWLLIVRLFDEERVILNPFGERLGRE